MEPVVAAFDVDGTLTVRDCVLPFLLRCGGGRGVVRALSVSPVRLVRMIAGRDRNGMKAHVVKAFLAGRPQDEIDALGAAFARRVAAGWMREDVAARLRRHQDQGHVVVLVSASLAPYLEPLGDLLEVDAVLCTRLQVVDGVLTGELDGPNCRAGEKAVRLSAWAGESGMAGNDWLGYAYGDSSGDTEMLAMAIEGISVAHRELA